MIEARLNGAEGDCSKKRRDCETGRGASRRALLCLGGSKGGRQEVRLNDTDLLVFRVVELENGRRPPINYGKNHITLIKANVSERTSKSGDDKWRLAHGHGKCRD